MGYKSRQLSLASTCLTNPMSMSILWVSRLQLVIIHIYFIIPEIKERCGLKLFKRP